MSAYDEGGNKLVHGYSENMPKRWQKWFPWLLHWTSPCREEREISQTLPSLSSLRMVSILEEVIYPVVFMSQEVYTKRLITLWPIALVQSNSPPFVFRTVTIRARQILLYVDAHSCFSSSCIPTDSYSALLALQSQAFQHLGKPLPIISIVQSIHPSLWLLQTGLQLKPTDPSMVFCGEIFDCTV